MTEKNVPNIQLDENLTKFLLVANPEKIQAKVTGIKSDEVTLDFSSKAMFVVQAPKSGAQVGDTITFDTTGKAVFVERQKKEPVTKTARSGSNAIRKAC